MGGAGMTGGRAKGPVVTAVIAACWSAATACSACMSYGTAAGAGASRAGAALGGRKNPVAAAAAGARGRGPPVGGSIWQFRCPFK